MTTPHVIGLEQDRIDREASTWVVLAAERPLSVDEELELESWRVADPRHDRSLREFRRTWADIAELNGLAELVAIEAAAPPAMEAPARSGWRRSPKLLQAAFAAIAVLVLAVLTVPVPWERQSGHYTTDVAQSRLLALPDGTQVVLGPKSSLAVKFSESERRVVLAGGEAFFEVVHDASRPFFVEAGASRVRVLGTKFNVNRSAGSVRVSVLQGLVEVRNPGTPGEKAAPILLRAGERVEIIPAAASVRNNVAPQRTMPAQAPGAWREGRLVYDNARVADLVADVNRYYAPGVILVEPSLGNLRVTASFKASEIPVFLNSLGGVVPVTARELPDGSFQLEPSRK